MATPIPPNDSLPDPLPPEPLALALAWFDHARARALQPNPNAMVLATVDAEGAPDARVVLCNRIDVEAGCLTFYTNYHSAKGRELAARAQACAVMHWDALHRQLRVRGPVTAAPAALSDQYFAQRPWQSRLGAWASRQSEPLRTRAELERALTEAAERFGTPSPLAPDAPDQLPAGLSIPRPPHWGGYRLWIESLELWCEGSARLHDRARWTRSLVSANGGYRGGTWSATRLQP